MGFIIDIFNQVLYLPLFNALIWLYNVIPGKDLGIAIVVLTVLIRFLLYPLSRKAIRSQKIMSKLQPKIKEIQKKYKKKEEQMKETMALYKEHNINPIAGCLPILIQLPILIALYRVFITSLDIQRLDGLYSFITQPDSLNVMFLGMINLSERSIFLALLAGLFQFIQSKMIMPKKGLNEKRMKIGNMDFSSLMTKQMIYFMPFITIFIAWNLPAALPLYWTVVTIFGVVQQYFTKTLKPELA